MSTDAQGIVANAWNFAHVLRNHGAKSGAGVVQNPVRQAAAAFRTESQEQQETPEKSGVL